MPEVDIDQPYPKSPEDFTVESYERRMPSDVEPIEASVSCHVAANRPSLRLPSIDHAER